MMVINCAHYKLAILRAYFYRQRRGVRRDDEGNDDGEHRDLQRCGEQS
jgi:hypothetical protein